MIIKYLTSECHAISRIFLKKHKVGKAICWVSFPYDIRKSNCKRLHTVHYIHVWKFQKVNKNYNKIVDKLKPLNKSLTEPKIQFLVLWFFLICWLVSFFFFVLKHYNVFDHSISPLLQDSPHLTTHSTPCHIFLNLFIY